MEKTVNLVLSLSLPRSFEDQGSQPKVGWPCQNFTQGSNREGATSRPLPAGLNTTRFQHFLIQHFFFQHYLISTLLHSTPIVFNTTLIQQAPIQHTLHSTHLVFNTFLYSTLLDFNNHGFNTTCFQHLWFQHSLFSTILVFNNPCFQHNLDSTFFSS